MKTALSENDNFVKVDNIEIPEIFSRRIKTNVPHLDVAFGGDGWVPGSTFTISGTPGSGKTTLLCQVLQQIALTGKKVAYISGEESVYQLAYNCRRIGAGDVPVANITDFNKVAESVERNKFDFIILDSIPCFSMANMQFYGKQFKEQALAEAIIKTAHSNECVIGCVMHVTKTGTYKGSTLLPHSVDATYHLKRDEEDENVRILENTKNRFGCAATTPLLMTGTGFSFDPIEEEPSLETTARISVLTVRSEKIIKHVLREGSIAMRHAEFYCEGSSQNAYLAIRNCVNNNQLTKQGRGDNAIWVIPS